MLGGVGRTVSGSVCLSVMRLLCQVLSGVCRVSRLVFPEVGDWSGCLVNRSVDGGLGVGREFGSGVIFCGLEMMAQEEGRFLNRVVSTRTRSLSSVRCFDSSKRPRRLNKRKWTTSFFIIIAFVLAPKEFRIPNRI